MFPGTLALLLPLVASAEQEPLLRLEAAVREHVASQLELDPQDVEIVHLGVAELPSCAEGARIVVDSPPSERFRGHADLFVELYGAEQSCASLRLRAKLRTWLELPVAAEDTGPGEAIAWELQRVPIDRIAGDPVTPELLADATWLARTTVARGEPLTELVLRARPDGASGERVQVMAGAGGLIIETPGRLMADAFVGETVRVANLATRGVHEGTLFAPGCVTTGAVTARMKEVCDHASNP